MGAGVQVLLDCPECRVEGAIVELIDVDVRFSRCRMCQLECTAEVVTLNARKLSSQGAVVEALVRWSVEEGEPDVHQFVAANFGGLSVDQVCARVVSGQAVATSFDVVAWLFRDRTSGSAGVGAAGGLGNNQAYSFSTATDTPGAPPKAGAGSHDIAPVQRESAANPPSPSRAITQALCTVALADGVIEQVERQVLARVLNEIGAPEPTDDDWRLWRPADLARPEHPERVIQAMREVALANQLPDPSESRVIREFARYWQVKVGENVLPPVTMLQKFVKTWEGWFGR